MEDLAKADLPYPHLVPKNLFLRDDKKRNFYLVTLSGDKQIDLKQFRNQYGTRALSFASEKYLNNLLELDAGAVSPFGLLNDEERKVKFYLDEDFLESPGIIGVHPNENTSTVWLKTSELVALIQEHGNVVHIEDL